MTREKPHQLLPTWLVLAGLAVVQLSWASVASALADRVEYNRDVRPILSDNCFYCHGPDKNHRDGKFRLDDRASALAKKAIVPGKPQESTLVERILSTDPDDQMPPPKTHKVLTGAQKDILKRWIAGGAEYQPHWAYIVPQRPAVPQVMETAHVKNAIDAFIIARLDSSHLTLSPEADKRTLLRRLSLDLIGLPPTPSEMQAFLDDKSANAYEKQVDRLLASPHYGERMAVPWLDAVRFADTVGFHGDQNQNVFPYRDYVISAFNNNKPFDQFTVEQLAGDLLPHPTTEQLVATCFNRLNMMTREGGAQPKEYLAKYAADRVRTVSNTFLGSTMGCCECHDHKFDPFTAKDFYSMESFWADVKQWGVYMDYGYTPNPDLRGFSNDSPFPPEIVVDSPYLHAREQATTRRVDDLATSYVKAHSAEFNAWEKSARAFLQVQPSGWIELSPAAQPTTKPAVSSDRLELALPAGTIASIRVELQSAGSPVSAARKKSKTGMVGLAVSMKSGKAGHKLPFFFADADHKRERYSSGYAVPGLEGGWMLDEQFRGPQTAVYLLTSPVTAKTGDTLQLTLGTPAEEVHVFVSPFETIKPLDAVSIPRLHTEASGSPVWSRAFILSSPGIPTETLADVRKLERDVYACRDGKSPVLVTEAATPRPMRVLRRGNWQDEGGEPVVPATPAFLTPTPDPSRRLTRLDLARWIVSPKNPLTSRAMANRLWKQFFGEGLCRSVEDLGAQGEMPTHPELLDWLAVEFQAPSTGSGQGWDVKHLVKLMVMSSAYRQDSNGRPESREIDPQNRLLASQSPRRLEAEFVRDNALWAAGLLNTDVGGPSAFPYQPDGYYANIQFPNRKYVADADDREYRRGIYMHWQRTFLHPMLANFDAPSREDAICTRNVSNTPQQALTLLNDPEYVEAARVLATKTLALGGGDEARLKFIYERALCRDPRANEAASLAGFLAEQRAYYGGHKDDAAKLVSVGVAPVPGGNDASELAAWTTVCRVVLNLHETITRY